MNSIPPHLYQNFNPVGNFHRILHLFSLLLTNAQGIAAKSDKLHFVKHKN